MVAFALSMVTLWVLAALLQFGATRRWLNAWLQAHSIAFASIAAALCLQVVTAGVTLCGVAKSDSSFMAYFYQAGYISIGGMMVAVLVPTVAAMVTAIVPAALMRTLLRPASD